MESSVREPKWEMVIQKWNLNTYFAQKDQKREIRKLLYCPKGKKVVGKTPKTLRKKDTTKKFGPLIVKQEWA